MGVKLQRFFRNCWPLSYQVSILLDGFSEKINIVTIHGALRFRLESLFVVLSNKALIDCQSVLHKFKTQGILYICLFVLTIVDN